MKARIALAFLLCSATPAFAQDEEPPKPITVSGSVALVSDYRFRGVSQTDEELAVQGGVTIAHESGFYVGTWASNLAGWGTFGGSNTELDIYGGFKLPVGGGTLDVGVTWYMYPGGADITDFAEPYVKLSGTLGPVSLLAGVAYAPAQEALGQWYLSGADAAAGVYNDPGDKEDNLYLWGDISSAIPNTPVTLKGHLGYSDGNAGLGPNGTSIAPTGKYWDWMLGADLAIAGTPLTLGVAYTDTDISDADAAYLLPNFSSTKDGSSISGSQVVFSLSAAF
ncbi:TorF family putative porin [Sphingomonas sp. HF-S4]|uniref:TorF family putative porin n=1 Tax=Sphingomonas agrestis TaxID=3080540 RepID=A0ABU3YCV6_9SPHN|nr:TorF family putative porin [Sphingomonas sp. HF-S4]MDV3459122.1 TorF family putative porin [Sphingomonas sp. HF-S4]